MNGVFALACLILLVSCVGTQSRNSIVEFYGVNELAVRLDEPASVGDAVHFLRFDCATVNGKARKCLGVPIADGHVKEVLADNTYRVILVPGGRVEAFAVVRKHAGKDDPKHQ